MTTESDGLSWEYDIPLLTNRYMLWDFARLFVVTFVLADVILLVATGFEYESVIPLSGLCACIFLALFVLVSVLLGNHVRSKFILDTDGVGSSTSRRMSKLNTATIVIGALTGSATATGAGLLASVMEQSYFSWWRIKKVTVDRSRRVLSFQNSWRTLQRVYCHEDNFETALSYVSEKLPGKVVFESRIGGS